VHCDNRYASLVKIVPKRLDISNLDKSDCELVELMCLDLFRGRLPIAALVVATHRSIFTG
jgi:hypothetical protein